MHRKEYEKAEKVLSNIENRIDCSILENYQYIDFGKIQVKYQKHLSDSEKLIHELKKYWK